jgi:hypothetical protein
MKKKFEGRQSEAKAPDPVLPRFSASKNYAAGADFQIKKHLKPNTVSLRLCAFAFKNPDRWNFRARSPAKNQNPQTNKDLRTGQIPAKTGQHRPNTGQIPAKPGQTPAKNWPIWPTRIWSPVSKSNA